MPTAITLQIDADALARQIAEHIGRADPPYISERVLAERWPWVAQRTLQEARLGNGMLFVKGRGRIRMPAHLAGGQKVAYFYARRPGIRTVLDVEDELAATGPPTREGTT